jgi:hypothetical protein
LTESTDIVPESGKHASAEVTTTQARSMFSALYDPDMDFEKLASTSKYYAAGYRLVDKADLVGVPFVIVGVTYRPGFKLVDGTQMDYVSCECVIANERTLNSNPVKYSLPAELKVYPNEPVIFNDGGKGVRRTLTQLFENIGLIDVGSLGPDNQENPYDRPCTLWAEGSERAQDGITSDKQGDVFRFVAPRGLQESEYESPYGPATTYYFG